MRSKKNNEIEWELGADEMIEDLDGDGFSADLFGAIPGSRVLADMEEAGLLQILRQNGYQDFYASKVAHSSTGDRFVIKTHQPLECVLVDVRTRSQNLKSGDQRFSALLWEWIGLYHPLGQFPPDRPALPGQEVPGLGIFKGLARLLHAYALELEVEVLLAIPEYFHNAWLYHPQFRFRDPIHQGRFKAMVRDLLPRGLAQASWALDRGQVECQGRPVNWEAHTMMFPLDPELESHFFHDGYQAEATRSRSHSQFSFREP